VLSVSNGQEEQVQRVRAGMLEKMNQLESQIQSKMELAKTRREQLEQEQLEKLRNHVSNVSLYIANFLHRVLTLLESWTLLEISPKTEWEFSLKAPE
jgi:DNA-directed RNA polymerase sigma subunit (sigma70/sigma32)